MDRWFRLLFSIGVLSCILSDSSFAELPDQEAIQKALQRIRVSRMVKDVKHLSGSYFQGRQAGTPGGRGSAIFVGERFDAIRMHAVGPLKLPSSPRAWFQPKTIATPRLLDSPTVEFLSWTNSPQEASAISLSHYLGRGYLPIFDSPSIATTAPVVFVGYGISDPDGGFDEYEGIEVQNRVVLFLRGNPTQYPHRVPHVIKEQVAREKGATGIMTVTGPILSPYERRRGIGEAPSAFYHNVKEVQPLQACG